MYAGENVKNGKSGVRVTEMRNFKDTITAHIQYPDSVALFRSGLLPKSGLVLSQCLGYGTITLTPGDYNASDVWVIKPKDIVDAYNKIDSDIAYIYGGKTHWGDEYYMNLIFKNSAQLPQNIIRAHNQYIMEQKLRR